LIALRRTGRVLPINYQAVNDMAKPLASDAISTSGGTGIDRLKAVRPDTDLLVTMARQLRYTRMRHAASFPAKVFRDGAWDMMLDLYVSAGEGTPSIGVKQLTLSCGASTTGAIRRIDRLEEAGLIRRRPHPDDQRRVFIELTAKGHAAMTGLLRDLVSMMPFEMATKEPTAKPVTFRPFKKGD
jgi:DNA-binding MarR family transcriptional regulator